MGYEMTSGRGWGTGGWIRGRLKGVRHQRMGVRVGIGVGKVVIDGGLVMEQEIGKVLGNLLRWQQILDQYYGELTRGIQPSCGGFSVSISVSPSSSWSVVWLFKSDVLRSGNIQIFRVLPRVEWRASTDQRVQRSRRKLP